MKIRLAALLAVIVLLSGCSTMMSPALEAIDKNDLDGLRKALDSGVSPDYVEGKEFTKPGSSLLGFSISRGRTDMTEMLLQRGADPNARIVRGDKKIPVLIKAYADGQPRIARALLDKGADPFARMEPGGGTVLHLFAETGNVGEARDVIARAKLAAGQRARSPEYADKIFSEWLDRPFEAGYTALHLAARNGKTDIIPLLIENGADPSLRDKGGHTAQYYLDQKIAKDQQQAAAGEEARRRRAEKG